MATKAEIIAEFKKDYPTIKTGRDQTGYTYLSNEDYEARINEWADNAIAAAELAEAEAAKESDKAALLAKLGITADEARLLLS